MPFDVYPGRVIEAYAGTNYYRLAGPYCTVMATYFGDGSGTTGVRGSGGLAVGTLVLFALAVGDNPSRIICVDQIHTDPSVDLYLPRSILQTPVSGYWEGSLSKQLLQGKILRGLRESRNDGIIDLVPGEWAKSSYFGAGVGVEHFRSWLGAGPMAELSFFTDTQLGRLRAMQWEHDTLMSQSADTYTGAFAEKTSKRFWTPAEAVDPDALPRLIEQAGPGHLGSHVYGAGPGQRGTPRRALWSDHVDENGVRVISAAGGVVLERRIDLDVPEEITPSDLTELGNELVESLKTPRDPLSFAGVINAVTSAQSVFDIIDSVTSYRARNAVDTVKQRWTQDRLPPESQLVVPTGKMWGDLPSTVEIPVGPEKTKKFYVGRSVVALLPDGNVVIENAHGAQIMAAGPNIVLSAPGDIIEICGGSKLTYAAKNVVIQGYEHVQVVANTGRLDLKAERQLSILGGNDGGAEGVLIESKSTSPTCRAGDGLEGSVGGVVILSESGIYAAAKDDVGVFSENRVDIRALDTCILDAPALAFKVTSQFQVFADSDRPLIELGVDSTKSVLNVAGDIIAQGDFVGFKSMLINSNAVIGGQLATGKTVVANGVSDVSKDPAAARSLGTQITANTTAIKAAVAAFETSAKPSRKVVAEFINRDVPMTTLKLDAYGFSFIRSAEYGLPGDFNFALPEMRWQQRSLTRAPWDERKVDSKGGTPTMAYPGYEIWSNPGQYLVAPEGLYFDIKTATSTLSQPGADPGAVVPAAEVANLNKLVRSP
jgi:hypothetical protein